MDDVLCVGLISVFLDVILIFFAIFMVRIKLFISLLVPVNELEICIYI